MGFVAVVAVAVVTALGAGRLALQEAGFPHDRHQGLFPVCAGCHEGIAFGVEATSYPDSALCARCHDGTALRAVAWAEASSRVSNVVFEHGAHEGNLSRAGDAPLSCEACHSDTEQGRMAVDGEVELGTCWGCHAHLTPDHTAEGDCAACHAPLARSGFDLARVEGLPEPADHAPEEFLEGRHGLDAGRDVGRCSTCHTAERCLACHVDEARAEIVAIPAAPTGMALPPAEARYPVPDTHGLPSWLATHGPTASVAGCITCHTAEDCTACHVPPSPALVDAFPRRAGVQAPGAMLEARAPDSHRAGFFLEAHGTQAAAGDGGCATCHTQSWCASCHDAPVGGSYHPTDFVARHAAAAFGRDDECASCHSTAVFCRSCHEDSGLTAGGRLGDEYHTAEPFWLLRHGQAARQSLESCASCHEQRQCVQCHGVLGAFKINPHLPGFDADAAWSRNPRPCIACHVRDPRGGIAR